MNDNLLTYNQAIACIQKGNFEEAEKLLRNIAHTGHSLTNWSLGLIYAATGRPFAALKHWEQVSPVEVEAVLDKTEKLLGNLPIYEEIFKLYNEALQYARKKDFASLPQRYMEILKRGEGIPLPVEIYKGLFLSSLVQGKFDQFHKQIAEAPDYVKKDVAIKAIVLKVNETQLKSEVKQLKKKSVKKVRIASGFLLAGAALLIITAGLAFRGFGENEKAQLVTTKENVSSVQNSDELKEEYENKLDSLVKENSILQSEVNKKSEELQKSAEIASLLELADDEVGELKVETALNLYQNGIGSFRNHRYPEAAEKLTKSLSISNTTYFADDAHFFLISSSLKTEGQGAATSNLMDDFLNQAQTVSYKESPYMDDVMLMRAEIYLQVGDKEHANMLLDRIESEFPSEWTAKKAKSLN